MNAKIMYDLGTDPMWTSVNVLIYLVVCLLTARAQEGQDASNTLDRDLAGAAQEGSPVERIRLTLQRARERVAACLSLGPFDQHAPLLISPDSG